MRELLSKDFFVDADIRRAESLPSSAFTNPNFLELEMETIFNKTWMLVPHHGSLGRSTAFSEFSNKPGSRVPFSLLGKPLFLQRNSKKTAFRELGSNHLRLPRRTLRTFQEDHRKRQGVYSRNRS